MDKYYRMSRERFEQLNQEQKASGLSIKDFCKHQGFSRTSFYFWRQKFGLAERATDNDPRPSPLTPINITEGGAVASTLPRQARSRGGQEWAKFGKVPGVAQPMPRMVGDALAAQAEGAQHRWQGAASPQGGARKGAGHRSAQPMFINVQIFYL